MHPNVSKLAMANVILLLLLAGVLPAMAGDSRPNIILIFTDD